VDSKPSITRKVLFQNFLDVEIIFRMTVFILKMKIL